MITFGMFAAIVGIAVVGLVVMAVKLYSESTHFITDLQFFLKHRTIAHNQVKARLAVLQSNFDELEQENLALQNQLRKFKAEAGFEGILAETEFVEEKKRKQEEAAANLT